MDQSTLRRLRAEAVAICQKNRKVLCDQDAQRLTEIAENIWQAIAACQFLSDDVRQEAGATMEEIYKVLQRYFLSGYQADE